MSSSKSAYSDLNRYELINIIENQQLELKKLKDGYEEKIHSLNFILQNLPASIYWKNREGIYLGQNDYAKKNMHALGFTKKVLGHTDYDIFPIEIADGFRESDLAVLAGHNLTTEEIITLFDGKKLIFLSTKIPLPDKSKNIIGILGISIDITKQKQAHIAKQEFMKNMAHDLRTPLTGIQGLAQLQEMGLESLEKSKEYGQMIHSAGNELLALLNAVIQVIDTEHMADPVKIEPFNLTELANELQALITPAIYTKRLQFKLKLDENLPIILSDRIKLKRILLNILSNAIKFTKKGEINLNIKLIGLKNKFATIEINISDTGIGIAEKNIDKIFERFYRVNPSYLAEYKGYGIGLYLVKETLNLLGGKIQVKSEEGKGSCFILHFNFPFTHKKPNKNKPSLASYSKIKKKIGPVLVAEDNALALHVVESLLKRAGYKVIVKMNGKAVLEALKKLRVAWVLLDIGLPELKGTEVCKQYRQWEKENNRPHLPIFVLTGHEVEEVTKECNEAGIDLIFTKPFTNETINEIELFLNKFDQ